MPPKSLSKADSLVLAQVFDPESAPTKTEVIVDPYSPEDSHITDVQLLAQLRAREKQAILLIEQCEKRKADADERHSAYRASLALLDSLIKDYPNYASARNNRAQLRRWRYGDRNTLCQRKDAVVDLERVQAGTEAVHDLQRSIALASPARPQDAVSPSQGRLLGQAYTQLAALYYAAAKDLGVLRGVEVGFDVGLGAGNDVGFDVVSDAVEGWDRDRFEEEGSRNFYAGGLYGNEVAKALAVHTNPHAKLCGNIVKEAMRKEFAAA